MNASSTRMLCLFTPMRIITHGRMKLATRSPGIGNDESPYRAFGSGILVGKFGITCFQSSGTKAHEPRRKGRRRFGAAREPAGLTRRQQHTGRCARECLDQAVFRVGPLQAVLD